MADFVDVNIPGSQDVQKMIQIINESQEMKLNENDILFVGLIAGLQIVRQWISRSKILNRTRLNDQEAAQKVKHNSFMRKIEESGSGRVEWILGPTSYDAIQRSSDYFLKTGIAGTNHRYTTLAHDPLVGLLVGPINLLSNTITYNTQVKFGTSKVLPNDANNPATGYSVSTPSSFGIAVAKSVDEVHSNKHALLDAVIKHLLHLASDIGTTQGLIIPGLSLLPNVHGLSGAKVNGWLLKNNFDAVWAGNIMAQFGIAEMINSISGFMYRFLLYRDSEKSKEFVDTKCQKVIAIANTLSSSEDLILSVCRALDGDVIGALRDLDWGGLLATIKRIIQSSEFRDEVSSIGHVWEDLKFNVQYSAADLKTEFQRNIQDIDEKYQAIVAQMLQEYVDYADLQAKAADLTAPSTQMFADSIRFSDLNHVDNSLRNKSDIDGFFNN